MKFKCTGGPYGDCTSDYDVIFEKPYTVSELINEVLQKKEWGYIGIYDGKSVFGNPNCEYRKDKIITESLPKKYMNKFVKKCKASGGWSRMDYWIYLDKGE